MSTKVKQLQLEAVPVSVASRDRQLITSESSESVAMSAVSLNYIAMFAFVLSLTSAILIFQDAVAVRQSELTSACIVYMTRIPLNQAN
jgi:hypothetical protein